MSISRIEKSTGQLPKSTNPETFDQEQRNFYRNIFDFFFKHSLATQNNKHKKKQEKHIKPKKKKEKKNETKVCNKKGEKIL